MQSGFNSGGAEGLPEFYTGVGGARSNGGNIMNNNNHHPQQFHNRSQAQGIFIDSSIPQIGAHRQSQNPASLIGKRTLAEFQYHQQNLTNQQSMYLRSLKRRTSSNFQHSSPISTLSPIDLSSSGLSGLSYTASDNSGSSANSSMLSQRYGLPLVQQLRPNPIMNPTFPANSSPYVNNNSLQIVQPPQNKSPIQNKMVNQASISSVDSEKKMIDDRLHELEKQLLDDNDDDEEAGDGVSVITNPNSEWSETMHSLIGANPTTQKPVSPSPTSSSTSSSSVASPATMTCSKQTLMEAASAIADGKLEAAAEFLTRLTQVVNPRPNSEQRLLEFMTLALKSKVNPADNPAPVAELWSVEHAGSTQFLYELLPCYRLGFIAANMAILEATLTEPTTTTNKVHVIDFDIGQGGQFMELLHALSTCGKPSVVKITTVAESGGEEKLRAVRERLTQVAKEQRVGLEFNEVSHKLSELTRESLGCDPDEPIAVNFAFKLYSMPDESVTVENPRDELLRRVKGLAPRVVTLVEQELNTNTAPFMARVNECCAYYEAMLDSVEAAAIDALDRVKAEEALSRKLANSVACEGRDRVERCEVFGKWRARMGMAGFELKPMSQNVTESLKQRLSPCSRATVKETNGAVSFGWISRTLTVASAWR